MANLDKTCKPNDLKNSCKPILKIYLTFDDGPNEGTTYVLDALSNKGVKAGFFMNSKNFLNRASQEMRYKQVRRMIDDNHMLADHGHDHNPAKIEEYKATQPKDVRPDFETSIKTFQTIFKQYKDVFPGFTAARLPGDGRRFESYKTMITSEIRLPHVGWGAEFAPNGTFLRREKQPLQPINAKDSDEEKLRKKNENEKITKGNEKRDFFRDWIPGVAATISPGTWPRPDDIILFHDRHWIGKRALLEKVIETLQKKVMIVPLKPLPIPHRVITPAVEAPQKKDTPTDSPPPK